MPEVGEPDIDKFVEGMIKVRDELKNNGSANILVSKAQQDQKEYILRQETLS